MRLASQATELFDVGSGSAMASHYTATATR